ncbi:hypothetical protein [Pseudomonas sp. TE24901]
MFRVNDTPSTYFREPYFPNNRDQHYGRHDTHRPLAEPHYHRRDRDHNANWDRPEFGPDRGYRHDRERPAPYRDRDHRFDRHLPETRHDRDYRPDRRLPETRHDRDYRPDRRLPETRHDRDYRPDRRLPETLHDRDYRPDRRLSDSRRDWDVRPRLDTSQTTRTIEAIDQLLDRIPNRKAEIDHGITSDDIRAGKYGALPPKTMKELEKLDKDQNYRLVILSSEKSWESAWIPTDGNKPTLTQPLNDDPVLTKNNHHPIWGLPEIIKTQANSINLGVTSDDLKKGAHGALSPEIKKSLDQLPHDKNYSLVSLPDYMGNGIPLLIWEDKDNRHNYVPIGLVEDRPH